MGSRGEISDTDSGIILQSSPDSIMTPVKDVSTHTRAVKLKQQSLQDQLELCLLELKKLCIREAELTGHLSLDYPLLPGEKPPCIRRRIGAAFRLNEESFPQEGEDSELRSVEAELALQQQIYEAARRLSLEDHLSKQVKRSRVQQCRREERKLKELQEAVFQLRLQQGQTSAQPVCPLSYKDPITSDDSSLSESLGLDEELTSEVSRLSIGPSMSPLVISDPPPQNSPHLPPPQALDGLRGGLHSPTGYDPSPIQNSPWKESSLDQPYEKPKKSRSSNSSLSCSPVVTPVCTPVEPYLGDGVPPFLFSPLRSLALRHVQSSSAPSTPELHLRRPHSQSFRIPNGTSSCEANQVRGRTLFPRRRTTELTPEHWPLRAALGNHMYHSSSEDSNSEYSVSSYASSTSHDVPGEPGPPCPAHHGQHYMHHNGYMPVPAATFYKNSQHQSHPNFYRGYQEELLLTPPPSCYEHWFEEATPAWMHNPPPQPPLRLARTPSLREHPLHYTRGLPHELVSDELRSWHQRNQFRVPRPRSLDRQGAVRIRSVHGRDSPLSQQYILTEQQVPHRQILQRAPDGTPVRWFVEEDSEIISQV